MNILYVLVKDIEDILKLFNNIYVFNPIVRVLSLYELFMSVISLILF